MTTNNGLPNLLDTSDDTIGGEDDSNNVVDPNKNGQVVKVQGPDKPLIIKIVPQKRPNGVVESYWKTVHHKHLVGDMDIDNFKSNRRHLCQKTLGRKECKECDRFWATKTEFYDLEAEAKKNPSVKASKAYKLADIQQKLLNPGQGGWAHVVLPNNPQVKALQVGKDLVNKLWGKDKTKFRPAVESLIKKMRAAGDDPYNLKSKSGWIVIWKTGEGRSTEYTVKAATQTVMTKLPNGREVPAEVPAEFDVHPNIFLTKRDELPNFMKFEERNVWTTEESNAFAENLQTPERVLKEDQGGDGGDDMTAKDGNGTPDIPAASALPPTVAATAALAAQAPVDPNAIDQVL